MRPTLLRRALTYALAVGTCTSLVVLSEAPAGASTNWGNAIELPGTAALNLGSGGPTSLSCASDGNCGAVGYYTDASGHDQPFVASESCWDVERAVSSAAALGGPVVLKADFPPPAHAADVDAVEVEVADPAARIPDVEADEARHPAVLGQLREQPLPDEARRAGDGNRNHVHRLAA